MKFSVAFLVLLVCAATLVSAGGKWGWGGKRGPRRFHKVLHHHYAPMMYRQPAVHYPVVHTRVVPVSHPVYIPVPIPVGRGRGHRDDDTVIIINGGGSREKSDD